MTRTASSIALAALLTTAALPAEARTQVYAPRNDDIAAAIVLTPSERLRPGELYYSSRELGEPKATAISMGRTVWYRYVAKTTGRAVVAVALGGMDAAPIQFSVYGGATFGKFVRMGSGGFTGTGTDRSGAVAFNTTAGATYMVQVDSAPQSGYFEGNFQIGLMQYGAAGGLALFTEGPTFLREDVYGTATILAVNGFKVKAAIAPSLGALGGFLSMTTSATTIEPGRTATIAITDDYNRDRPTAGFTVGALTVTARNAGTATALGEGSTPVAVGTDDRAKRPKMVARFDRPGQGTRATEAVTSLVTVANTAADEAKVCRFLPTSDAFAFTYAEVSGSKLVNVDKPFAVAGGQTRRFSVTMTSTGDGQESVSLDCGGYATVTSDYLSRMYAIEHYGLASDVTIEVQGTDALKRLAVPDATYGRMVLVKLTNTGEYAGDFDVKIADEEYQSRADVTAVCASDAAGKCLVPAGTYKTTVNLARGEAGWVALKLNRGADPTSGFVYIDVESIESPTYRDAAYGGFEVVKP